MGGARGLDRLEVFEGLAAREAAERLADTGMTDAERRALEGLQAQQSLAALTAGTEDDRAAAGGIEGFLSGILAAAQSDPARGGVSAVRDIADQLAQARSNVASFAGGGGNANVDLQAQLDQERVRRENGCTNRCSGQAGCVRPTAGCTSSPHTACRAVDLVNDGAPVSRTALRACGLAKTTAPHRNHYDLVN